MNRFFCIRNILTLLLMLTLIITASCAIDPTFSPERWDSRPMRRYAMILDLMDRYDFESMTIDEVIKILGVNKLSINATVRHEVDGRFLQVGSLSFRFDENSQLQVFSSGFTVWSMVNEVMERYNFTAMNSTEVAELLRLYDLYVREVSLRYAIGGGMFSRGGGTLFNSDGAFFITFNENLEVVNVVHTMRWD